VVLTKYCKFDQIEKNEVGGDVAGMGKRRVAYRVLVGKHEVRRPLARPRRREDIFETDPQEVG